MDNDTLSETPASKLQFRTRKALQVCEYHQISRAECFADPWEAATPEINQKLQEYKQKFELRQENQLKK